MDAEVADAGFVFVDEICPNIVQCLRYSTPENFLGTVIRGYGGRRAILTRLAAEALALVQQRVAQDGFTLLIYDTYRPQKAVDHFAEWSLDTEDTLKQEVYYPRIDKSRVFELGYVAKRSGHSRGSTVDLTLLPICNIDKTFSPPIIHMRSFTTTTTVSADNSAANSISNNGNCSEETISLPFLDDNSVDMGTSFDLMDVASHYACSFISPEAQTNRLYLRQVMIEAGFRPYDEEWWHFTLNNEPYPDTYFDFDVPV